MMRWCFQDTCLDHMKYVLVWEWYILICPPRGTASGELKWQGVICLPLFDSSGELIEINVWIDYKAHIIQPIEKCISVYFIIIIGVQQVKSRLNFALISQEGRLYLPFLCLTYHFILIVLCKKTISCNTLNHRCIYLKFIYWKSFSVG